MLKKRIYTLCILLSCSSSVLKCSARLLHTEEPSHLLPLGLTCSNWSIRSGHLNKCDIDCTDVPHSQSVSVSSVYPHLCMLYLHRPTPVRSLLRDVHVFQSHIWPGGSCSLVEIGSFSWWWF